MIDKSIFEGSMHLVVAWVSGKSYSARLLKMSGEVSDSLKSYAEQAVSGLSDPTAYAPDADMEDNSHMEAPRDESIDTALIDELCKGPSLDLVTDAELRSKAVTCHALVVKTGAETILFVKKRSPIHLAKKSLVATLIHGRLDEIESPLFAFDNRYDVIIKADMVYVLDKKAFEGLFKNSDAVLAKTGDWVKDLSEVVPFADGSVAQLEFILRKNSVLRNKFLAVQGRPYLREITPESLRSEMSKYGLDPADLMDGDSLKVTTGNAKDVLRLLNEDLFRGGFSQQQYAASAKRSLR